MSELTNLTGFGAATLPAMDVEGHDMAMAVVEARFRLPVPGDPFDAPLAVDHQQDEPSMGDVYHGMPGRSSIRFEGQAAYRRIATDITMVGHAHAPHGQAVGRMKLGISIGQHRQEATVYGDRRWERSLSGAGFKASAPEPFDRMPILWERAFGGSRFDDQGRLVADDARNPLGRGLAFDTPLTGTLLPNIESPSQPISGPDDRPVPLGFGPVSRHWIPRRDFAGTYDEQWRRRRAPLWPADFDLRFFNAAPVPLQARPHLQGGEPVVAVGLHPDGVLRFQLPSVIIKARFRFDSAETRVWMALDGVSIDTDRWTVSMIYRASVPAEAGVASHRETVLRRVAAWERRA